MLLFSSYKYLEKVEEGALLPNPELYEEKTREKWE